MPKNSKTKAVLEKQPKSRAEYPLLPDLEEIIKRVKTVPYDDDGFSRFADFDVVKGWHTDDIENETGKKAEINIVAFLKKLLSDLPEDTQHLIKSYLGKRPSPVDLNNASRNEIQEIILHYKLFYYDWANVYHYITQRNEQRKGIYFSFGEKIKPIRAFLTYDSNGDEKLFGFAGLIGKFNGDRLRICKICGKVFWAKRYDSLTCSEQCANNLRVRLSRSLSDEEKMKRKMQREANRNLVEKGKAKISKRSK